MNAINGGNVIEVKGRFVMPGDAELADVMESRCDEYEPRVEL